MKRLLAILLAAVLLLSLTACGGNKKDIVGTWELVDKETQTEYGLGLEFTKDGKLYYGLTEDDMTTLSGDEDVDKALSYLMSIEYKIKSDTEMEITMKALLGLAKEKTVIPYSLDGDTLVFDGNTYARVTE